MPSPMCVVCGQPTDGLAGIETAGGGRIHTHCQFRTPSGQVGRTAYVYELAQIENSKRQLDARMRRLCRAMSNELPRTATYQHHVSEKLQLTGDADTIKRQLAMAENCSEFSLELLSEILATLTS